MRVTVRNLPNRARVTVSLMNPDYVQVAKCLANPARSLMVACLLDGRAMTAGELARAAGVLPSTASEHLGQLLEAGLVTATRQGRHRYFTLASEQTAEGLEALARMCPPRTVRSLTASQEDAALSFARMCYDHLAGRLGVAILEAVLARDWLLVASSGFDVTDDGRRGFELLGIDLDAAQWRRRVFARTCLDWTERRPHLAGALGGSLASALLDQTWLERRERGRGIRVTPRGAEKLSEILGVQTDQLVKTASNLG
jgi:DNA-binding transcriptional ArsR family regulator